MVGIDESLDFKPVTVAVLTVSDTRTRENDTSGDILQARIEAAGHKVTGREIVRDTIEGVRAQLQSWMDNPEVDVIISTGGTFCRFSPRKLQNHRFIDVTITRLRGISARHHYFLPTGV